MINYRITFVYSDASTRERYAKDWDDVSDFVRDELHSNVSKPILTVHIAYLGV